MARHEVDRRNAVKAEKLYKLRNKIYTQREQQKELNFKHEMIKREKEEQQAQKLKVAYDNMLVFEKERLKEKQERANMLKKAKKD